MPHLTIEYSANLENHSDIAGLCLALHRAMGDTGMFELGAIRVRAVHCTDYAIADLLPENMFADLRLRIGAGRTQDEKHRAGETIFAAASLYFARLFAAPHFALTLDIVETDVMVNWKKNAIHPRLRAK